jgi:hypothetical protein
MASNVHITAAIRNLRVDAVGDLADAGTIKIYDGTQPANAGVAVSTQVLGVTLTFNAAAFPASSAGSATAAAITSGVAVATISPTWARWFKSDGVTVILDCSVGVSAGSPDITIPGASISSGTTVSMSSLTISEAA